MKQIIFKKVFVATLVLSGLGFAGSASAHDQEGALGQGAKKTDTYQANCAAGTHHLSVQIKGSGPVASPLLSIQVIKGMVAKNVTDPVTGDAAFSPEMKVNGDDGAYGLIVDKTGAGVVTYALEVHCIDGSGGHPATNIIPIQNK